MPAPIMKTAGVQDVPRPSGETETKPKSKPTVPPVSPKKQPPHVATIGPQPKTPERNDDVDVLKPEDDRETPLMRVVPSSPTGSQSSAQSSAPSTPIATIRPHIRTSASDTRSQEDDDDDGDIYGPSHSPERVSTARTDLTSTTPRQPVEVDPGATAQALATHTVLPGVRPLAQEEDRSGDSTRWQFRYFSRQIRTTQ